jgi:hypothetical protein
MNCPSQLECAMVTPRQILQQKQSCWAVLLRLVMMVVPICITLGTCSYEPSSKPQLIASLNDDLPQARRNQTTLVVYLYAAEDAESVENLRFFIEYGITADHTADYLVVLQQAAQVPWSDLYLSTHSSNCTETVSSNVAMTLRAERRPSQPARCSCQVHQHWCTTRQLSSKHLCLAASTAGSTLPVLHLPHIQYQRTLYSCLRSQGWYMMLRPWLAIHASSQDLRLVTYAHRLPSQVACICQCLVSRHDTSTMSNCSTSAVLSAGTMDQHLHQ